MAEEDVVVLPPGEVVASAAELPGPVERVELADGVLVVQAGGQVLWRGLGDVGEWSSMWGGLPLTGDLVDAEGDVVLTQAGADGPGTLTWAFDGGGSREVPAGTVLGRGGQYVGYPTDTAEWWRVQPAVGGIDGVEIRTWTDLAIAGDRVAAGSYWAFTKLASTGVESSSFGPVCSLVDAAGVKPEVPDRTDRWVVASCEGRAVVLDDAGDLAEPVYRPIPLGSTRFDPERLEVGEGVVVGLVDGVLTAVPMLGGSPATLPGSVRFDLGDDGRTLAHLDSHGDVRIADVGSVASTMRSTSGDTTPPVANWPAFTSDGQGFRVTSPTRTYMVTASGYDPTDSLYRPSGVARIELRHGPTASGPWTTVPEDNVSVTYPAGSQECWQARATDVVGNVGTWSQIECVRIDDRAPVVSPKTPPAVTKALTSGSTSVKFTYSAKDDLALDTHDVRYRVTPKGRTTSAWVYPSTRQKTTATSILVSAPKSSVACFSVRARDRAGNTSSWSNARCTYLDGTAPKLTRTWMSGSFLSPIEEGVIVWRPRYAAVASDDRGVTAYQVQERSSNASGTPSATTSTSGWSTKREFRLAMEPGDQECRRIRARDAVGNIGSWSRWRCAQAPVTSWFGWDVSRTHILPVGSADVVVTSKTYMPRPRTDDSYVARLVRLKVRTGPNEGKAQVFVGDRYLGTISGKSSRVGWKWVTVSASTPGKGRVNLRAITYAPTRISTTYVMRWQP